MMFSLGVIVRKEIAPARTFGFDYEVEYLKQNNLALGGTLENAIVIKKDGVLNLHVKGFH